MLDDYHESRLIEETAIKLKGLVLKREKLVLDWRKRRQASESSEASGVDYVDRCLQFCYDKKNL